jgi:hypothetical protein
MTHHRSGEFTWASLGSGEASARQALGGILPEGTEDLLDRCILLLSELFSGDGLPRRDPEVVVRVDSEDETLRIEVRDAGSGAVLDALRRPSATGRSGWSPHLLSTVADRWGLVSSDVGAWVWFEFDYASKLIPGDAVEPDADDRVARGPGNRDRPGETTARTVRSGDPGIRYPRRFGHDPVDDPRQRDRIPSTPPGADTR